MTDHLSVAVPGSVLLLGEYAITEPDAPGIALAVLPEVRATCDPCGAPRISGRMGSQRFSWTPQGCDSPLLEALVQKCGAPVAGLEVDSSGFVGPHGKLGLGSSAAVAVAVAALLLAGDRGGQVGTGDTRAADGGIGGSDGEAERRRVFVAALAAHRAAQGGSGSGYDVATSVWGGVVHFRGGRLPAVARHRPPPLPHLCLVPGSAPLATPAAVARYERWCRRDPAAAAAFRARSRATVEQFLEATDAAACCAAIRAGGELTRWLGIRIGVAVEPPDLRARLDRLREHGWTAKPVGAGGELGIAVAPVDGEPATAPAAMPVRLAPEGLRWLN